MDNATLKTLVLTEVAATTMGAAATVQKTVEMEIALQTVGHVSYLWLQTVPLTK